MHIRFVNPRMNHRPVDSKLKFKLLPPQSLLLLAGMTPEEHTVELFDENIKEFAHDDTPDLVAMPVYVATAKRAYAIAALYRARGVKVVLGGIHPTCCSREATQHADAIILGEAESLWQRLLKDLENDQLSLVYLHGQPVPLESIPHLRRDLCDARYYASVNAMRASRGCPYRCKFCYQSTFYKHKGIRHRPVPDILDEIRAMNTRHVLFLDDNLMGDRDFARDLFLALAELQITWSGATSLDVAQDPSLLNLAHRSGCRTLFIGFESISQANLAQSRKARNKVALYDSMINTIHEHGIMINGSFILGMDHDTTDTFPALVDWINRQRIETATFHILTPYPGTPLYDELEQAGRIIDRDWDHYNTANVVFRPAQMSLEELKAGYDWVYREIYSWSSIRKRLPEIPSLRLPYLAFVLGYKKFARLTHWLGRMGMMSFMFDIATHLFHGRTRPSPTRKPKPNMLNAMFRM